MECPQCHPGARFLGLAPAVLDQNLYSAFLQDEILLGHDWSATIGSKVEHNDYTGFEVEPNVRLEWGFAPGQALWSAISRAARTPSRFDRDLVVADMSGRGIRGSMEIRLNGRDRVSEISMSADGRDRFELRWRQ